MIDKLKKIAFGVLYGIGGLMIGAAMYFADRPPTTTESK